MMNIQKQHDEEPKHWITKGAPPLVSYLLSQRWPPLREKELRADCSSFLFSSRMQAFNRLVDHVTWRLPLSAELAKAHTEHAQSVQISIFFSPESRATTISGSHFIAGKGQERYGEAIETWSFAVYHRNQEKDCVILNLLSSLKRSLSLLSPLVGHRCHERHKAQRSQWQKLVTIKADWYICILNQMQKSTCWC